MTLLAQIPRRDGEHHQAAGDERREDHVRVAPHERRVDEQRPDVVQHGLAALAQLVADRVLHPRVGDQNEHRRQHRTDRHRPDARQMHPLGEPVPAEQPQPDKRRLEEEGSQALHRQRRSEHAAHEARVGGPVHPELELLHESGDDADRHVDQQQRPEEACHPLVVGVVRAVPGGLQDRHQERKADRHRHEQKVIDARRGELPSRQVVGHPDPDLMSRLGGRHHLERVIGFSASARGQAAGCEDRRSPACRRRSPDRSRSSRRTLAQRSRPGAPTRL